MNKDSMSDSYTVVVLGDGCVGKSSLIIQAVLHKFVENYETSSEESFSYVFDVDGSYSCLEIIDTTGKNDSSAISKGQGFIIVFDVNNPASFDIGMKFQNDIMVTLGKKDVPIVFCGNKCDLQKKDVNNEQFNFENLTYIETSAKNGTNVFELFSLIIRMLRKQNKASKPPSKCKVQ